MYAIPAKACSSPSAKIKSPTSSSPANSSVALMSSMASWSPGFSAPQKRKLGRSSFFQYSSCPPTRASSLKVRKLLANEKRHLPNPQAPRWTWGSANFFERSRPRPQAFLLLPKFSTSPTSSSPKLPVFPASMVAKCQSPTAMPSPCPNPTPTSGPKPKSWSPIPPASAAPTPAIPTSAPSTTGTSSFLPKETGPRLGRRRLPHRRHRLHRMQSQNGRPPHPLDRPRPRTSVKWENDPKGVLEILDKGSAKPASPPTGRCSASVTPSSTGPRNEPHCSSAGLHTIVPGDAILLNGIPVCRDRFSRRSAPPLEGSPLSLLPHRYLLFFIVPFYS